MVNIICHKSKVSEKNPHRKMFNFIAHVFLESDNLVTISIKITPFSFGNLDHYFTFTYRTKLMPTFSHWALHAYTYDKI